MEAYGRSCFVDGIDLFWLAVEASGATRKKVAGIRRILVWGFSERLQVCKANYEQQRRNPRKQPQTGRGSRRRLRNRCSTPKDRYSRLVR